MPSKTMLRKYIVVTCRCQMTYSSVLFSVMDYCFNSPCQNNVTCLNLADNYTCACPAQFTGRDCEGWFYTGKST